MYKPVKSDRQEKEGEREEQRNKQTDDYKRYGFGVH
jgi:hypothetical protein